MSEFANKIMRGELPTDEEWSDHLMEAHKIAPSMTPNAFAEFKTEKGLNSYELLARELQPLYGKDATVLDLACGDGHLMPYFLSKLGKGSKIFGIDMADGELEIGRKKITDTRVRFYRAKARQIPLPDQSVDHIVCHMAFMLMLPVEPVVREISRLLKPSGKFSAVIGSKTTVGLFSEIRKANFQFIHSRYPKVK